MIFVMIILQAIGADRFFSVISNFTLFELTSSYKSMCLSDIMYTYLDNINYYGEQND